MTTEHECELPIPMREELDFVCPCGKIWAVMEGDPEDFYWESIGNVEEDGNQ